MIYRSTLSLVIALAVGAPFQPTATEAASVIKNQSIAYVLTENHWAIYQTRDGKIECPNGLNDGPREEFKALYPGPYDGAKWTYVGTAMARESEIWFPGTNSDALPFQEVQSKIAYGLNLDGKIGPNDFTSPGGEQGIDNQLYRALGCIATYRGPDGFLYFFNNHIMQNENYNRVVIELTNVDSLINDDDVTLTTYRGLDPLLTDASGQDYLPGGTQRLDLRWGRQFIQHFHGRIKNGVFESDAADLTLPAAGDEQDVTVQLFRGLRWQLKLTPKDASGLMAGYVDVDAFYRQSNESWSTHHHSYGQNSASSMYRALRRLADGYPDPKTGQNTAISSAVQVKFKQVFILRPLQQSTQTAQIN